MVGEQCTYQECPQYDTSNKAQTSTFTSMRPDAGWGVISKPLETAGCWTNSKKEDNINVRELKAILFVVQLHMNTET
jgi:hypothetical protein